MGSFCCQISSSSEAGGFFLFCFFLSAAFAGIWKRSASNFFGPCTCPLAFYCASICMFILPSWALNTFFGGASAASAVRLVLPSSPRGTWTFVSERALHLVTALAEQARAGGLSGSSCRVVPSRLLSRAHHLFSTGCDVLAALPYGRSPLSLCPGARQSRT